MSNVVALDGGDVAVAGVPNEHVVRCLEDLLARATQGQLHYVAVVADTPDGAFWETAGTGAGFDIIGGLEMAKRHISRLLDEA